jgi:hypothetical protein
MGTLEHQHQHLKIHFKLLFLWYLLFRKELNILMYVGKPCCFMEITGIMSILQRPVSGLTWPYGAKGTHTCILLCKCILEFLFENSNYMRINLYMIYTYTTLIPLFDLLYKSNKWHINSVNQLIEVY